MEKIVNKRYTTEFIYGGVCCVDGIEDIAIQGVNAPTFVGEAIDKLKMYEDLGTVEELEAAMKYVRLAKKHGTIRKVFWTDYQCV